MNRHPDYLLNRVNEPADIKSMSLEQLKQLATEMRQLVLNEMQQLGVMLAQTLELWKQRLHIITFLTLLMTRLFGMFPTNVIRIKC